MTERATPRVPFCDLRRQAENLHDDLLDAARRVLRSGRYIAGPEVAAFEQAAAQYLGASAAVGVASGTDALMLALRAAGVAPGDLVLTSPFTFFATASAILACGALPVFADIDPHTFNLDPAQVAAALEGRSAPLRRLGIDPGTIRALIPVHLYGRAAPMAELVEIAAQHHLRVIEDAAQAMGTRAGEQAAGTWGAAACFSFFPSKNLGGYGDGGLVVTNDPALARRVRLLARHGAVRPHEHLIAGTNSRLDELQAALLSVKLRRLDAWIEARRRIAAAYHEGLRGANGVTLPEPDPGYAYHQYTVRVPGGRRDTIRRKLRQRGIETAIYYPTPLHMQPALASLGYEAGSFPAAEAAAAEVLSLPMFPELRADEIEEVVSTLRSSQAR
ncbi:MAG: DegT/DnrJ/EryC1/StrS family aminotransferase [Actinomycetota bacterium]